MNLQTDVNWDGYLRELPLEITGSIRRYLMHCSLNLREENRIQQTRSLLSELSAFSRSAHLTCIQESTPRVWFTHIESRMKASIKPSSLNTTLRIVQPFLCYLKINGVPVCETMQAVRPLKTGETLPRDLTASQVKVLLQIVSTPMDRAWILLMLHSGLRRRIVFLSPQTIQALNCLPRNSEYVFIYRDQPLSRRYCQSRLTTMGRQCGIHVTPHQLRHTCATMLLNAGMSILGVQKILGHKYVETTLRYARAYDGTVVRDFKKAGNRR